MAKVRFIFMYDDFSGWVFGLKYQCGIDTQTDMIYARSEKTLAKKLKKLGVEMPELSNPEWTGIHNQHIVYDENGIDIKILEVLKERYDR